MTFHEPMRRILTVLLTASFLAVITGDGQAANPDAKLCGPDCLYIALKLFDKRATYDELILDLHPGEAGLTLVEMQTYAKSKGFHTSLAQLSHREIARTGVFVIAFDKSVEEMATFKGPNHFIIARSIGNDFVQFINPPDFVHEKSIEFDEHPDTKYGCLVLSQTPIRFYRFWPSWIWYSSAVTIILSLCLSSRKVRGLLRIK